MELPKWVDKNFIKGVLIELAVIVTYVPITSSFYYGGGWPFIPPIFFIIYTVGSVYIFKSQAPRLLKIALVFWWVIYVVVALVAISIGNRKSDFVLETKLL
jgi:hypothetical protein